MSTLTMQADSLRKHAERMRQLANGAVNQGFPARQYLFESAAEMREAADTIESLRERLQEVGYQACHATQPNYEHCKYSTNRGWRDVSRYAELFGTPERAARTLAGIACDDGGCEGCSLYGAHCTYDGTAQLEWLRGENEVIDGPDTIRNEMTHSGLVNEQIRDAEMQIVVLKEQLRVANESHCAICVDCGTPLSGEIRCMKCAATLGSEGVSYIKDTCEDVGDEEYFECGSCGSRLSVTPYFCPNCGKRVRGA